MKHQSNNVVPIREEAAAALRHARVVSVSGREAEIALPAGVFGARVALSCLVQPRPDDRVLVGWDDTGDYYVLAIVERPGDQDLAVSFPADAVVLAEHGSVTVASSQSVTLASAKSLNLVSDRTVHKGREAVISYDDITASAGQVQANFSTVRLVGRMLTTVVHNAIQKFHLYVRQTDQADRVRAGQISRQADGLCSIETNQTIMVSKKETKIDGERIFMG